MTDVSFTDWVQVGYATVAVVIFAYMFYRKRKVERSPEYAARVEERKRKREEELRTREEQALQAEKWAETHPRSHSLLKCLGYGAAAAVMLWIGIEEKSEWKSALVFMASAISALVSLFWLLGALFTPNGAWRLIAWMIGGGGVLWAVNKALESPTGTIFLGFIILIWIVLVGIEEIKSEIRTREESLVHRVGELQ